MGVEKILNRSDLSIVINNLKKQGKKIVFTNGCFDILHPGHVTYLDKAKKLGDVLVLGLNSDASVKRLKGKNRPVLNQEERATIISHLEMVDFICIFDEDTPYELISLVKPDVLVKGGDWSVENIVGKDIVESYGGLVINIPYIEGKSTTGIIERILKIYGA